MTPFLVGPWRRQRFQLNPDGRAVRTTDYVVDLSARLTAELARAGRFTYDPVRADSATVARRLARHGGDYAAAAEDIIRALNEAEAST